MEYFLILIWGLAAWVLICNERTCTQRIRIINSWNNNSDTFWCCAKEYNLVSYNKHMWYLITFRNPRKLYGPLTQSIW